MITVQRELWSLRFVQEMQGKNKLKKKKYGCQSGRYFGDPGERMYTCTREESGQLKNK